VNFVQRLLGALGVAFIMTLPIGAWAQSACTAMFGIVDNDAGGGNTVNSLRYYNTTSNQWVTLGNVDGGASSASGYNALAGSSVNGLLYYVNRTSRQLRSINLNTVPFTDTAIGIIPTPIAPATATNILGATTDATGRLFVYATDGTNEGVLAQVSVTTAGTVTAWTQLQTTGGVDPNLAGSGDIYCNNGGACFVLTNTNPPTLHSLNLTPGASFARTVSPPLVVTGLGGTTQIAGVAVDPASQTVYFSATSAGSTTYVLNPTTGAATIDNSSAAYWITDMGNCVVPPAAPALTKTFTPPARSGATGTSTVALTLGNSNTNPIFLKQAFQDVLPAGMLIANTPNLVTTCSSAFGTPTTTAGSNSVTFVTGGRIPAGGCSISFNVSATASLTPYTNTIPAGSLTTTAGDAAATQAVFRVGSDFAVSKSQRAGTTNPLQTTALSIPGGQTLQYVLTIVNTFAGGSGSVTFTDTLPQLMTPVLSITALQTGGGSCSTATAVVGGRTRVTGTVTTAPAGATCTVTVTTRGSSTLAVSTTVQNTVTIAGIGTGSDLDASNNNGTVTTTVTPVALLTVTKTNNVTALAGGQTTSYTVTVANLGPAPANNSVVTDAPVPGLACSAATCAVTGGGAVCPPTTVAALQGGGVTIATFPASSSLTFRLTCGVSATGLP
jgi:uncharacterized repeat protein (TIGR01451 family)